MRNAFRQVQTCLVLVVEKVVKFEKFEEEKIAEF